MEYKLSVPFKEGNLRYLSKYKFNESQAIKYMKKCKPYFWILERGLIFDSGHPTFQNNLNYIKRHAFLLYNNSMCYFWNVKYPSVLLLYIHYISVHHKLSVKVHIKREKVKLTGGYGEPVEFSKTRPTDQVSYTCYLVIEEKENCALAESKFSTFSKSKNFFVNYTEKDRKYYIDTYVLNKEFIYKTIDDIKEENEQAANIAEEVFQKYLIIIDPDKKSEYDKKNKIEYDKALIQPFNFDYYSPVTGEAITCFAENTLNKVPGASKFSKKNIKSKKSKHSIEDDVPVDQYDPSLNHNYYEKDPQMDLFTILSTSEIERYNSPTETFMKIWNKINRLYLTGEKGQLNSIGAKLRDFIQYYVPYSSKEGEPDYKPENNATYSQKRKMFLSFLEVLRDNGQIELNDIFFYMMLFDHKCDETMYVDD